MYITLLFVSKEWPFWRGSRGLAFIFMPWIPVATHVTITVHLSWMFGWDSVEHTPLYDATLARHQGLRQPHTLERDGEV